MLEAGGGGAEQAEALLVLPTEAFAGCDVDAGLLVEEHVVGEEPVVDEPLEPAIGPAAADREPGLDVRDLGGADAADPADDFCIHLGLHEPHGSLVLILPAGISGGSYGLGGRLSRRPWVSRPWAR